MITSDRPMRQKVGFPRSGQNIVKSVILLYIIVPKLVQVIFSVATTELQNTWLLEVQFQFTIPLAI